MPRVGDAMLSIDEVPRRPEVVSAETGDTRDVARPGESRGVAYRGKGGQDESVVFGGRRDAPTPRAFEQDVVDDVFGPSR
jgi:hypothetical protein